MSAARTSPKKAAKPGNKRASRPVPASPEDGWKTHEREQRAAWAKLTYQQRLDWLEQAKEFVREAMKSAQERRRGRTGRVG